MTHVALLRGINVGGNNKVDMRLLKACFERAGMRDVSTYINSGNVVFEADAGDTPLLAARLEDAIEADFGFRVAVLVRTGAEITAIASALPAGWVNDSETRCDVLYLMYGLDDPGIIERLPFRPGIDDTRYTPGAVLWHVRRNDVRRSGMVRIIGTELYRGITVRNCNTARKLAELVRLRND